jgi:hypothetical protein
MASKRRHLELLVAIFECVFHFHASNLPQALGHPLSNQKIYEKSKDGKFGRARLPAKRAALNLF